MIALIALASASGCDRLHESRAENLRTAAIEHFDIGEYDKGLEVSEIAIRLGADGLILRGMRGSVLFRMGQPEKALSEFDDAIAFAIAEGAVDSAEAAPDRFAAIGKISFTLKDLHISRGGALQALGRYEECLESYEKAIEADETNHWAYNNVAWLLATAPDDAVRDGKRAIEFANKACELTEWKNPACLDTLAAAYAEAGDFENAVKWQKDAATHLDSADTENQSDFASRLRLYSKGKQFRQDPVEKYRNET